AIPCCGCVCRRFAPRWAMPPPRRTISKRLGGWAIGCVGGDDRECPAPVTPDAPGPIVGRQDEVATLERWFQRAAHGARQVVFVSGEVGVGKTTVLELWHARLGAESGIRLAWGQCIEHTGTGEPYLPLLQALGQLCRGPHHLEVLAVLRQYAPQWLV